MGWQDYLPDTSSIDDPRSIGSRVGRGVGELNEWRKSIKARWEKAETYRILKQQGKPIPPELEAFIAAERAKDVPAQVDPNATALPYNPLDPANPANKFETGKKRYQQRMRNLDTSDSGDISRPPIPPIGQQSPQERNFYQNFSEDPFRGPVMIERDDGTLSPPTDAEMGRYPSVKDETPVDFEAPKSKGLFDYLAMPFKALDEGVGQVSGLMDDFRGTNIGKGLGGIIDRAGGLMGDPAFRGFAGMMDESSYYDKQGFYGGVGRGLSTAGGLYDAASLADSKRLEALAKSKAAGMPSSTKVRPLGSGVGIHPYRNEKNDTMYRLSLENPKFTALGGGLQQLPIYKKGFRNQIEGHGGFKSEDDAERFYKSLVQDQYDGDPFNRDYQEMTATAEQQHKRQLDYAATGYTLDMLQRIIGSGEGFQYDKGYETSLLEEAKLGKTGAVLLSTIYKPLSELSNLTGQDWNTDTGKATIKLKTIMAQIKANIWRNIVGRGQLSKADYVFLDDNLSVFQFGMNKEMALHKMGIVVNRLKAVHDVNGAILNDERFRGWSENKKNEYLEKQWRNYEQGKENDIDRYSPYHESISVKDRGVLKGGSISKNKFGKKFKSKSDAPTELLTQPPEQLGAVQPSYGGRPDLVNQKDMYEMFQGLGQ